MKYELVIFDWDGCLFKSNLMLLTIFKYELAKQGIIVDDEIIVHKVFGKWLDGLKALGVRDPGTTLNTIFQKLAEKLYGCELHDGAKLVLAKLRKSGVKIVISAPAEASLVAPHIDRLKLTKFIEAYITDKDFKFGKTNPEVMLAVVDNLRVSRNKVLLVGNSLKDIVAAKNAGFDIAIFYPKENHKIYNIKEIEKLNPTYIFTKLSEVAPIVLGK